MSTARRRDLQTVPSAMNEEADPPSTTFELARQMLPCGWFTRALDCALLLQVTKAATDRFP